jgi:hypothetical protein
MERVKKVKQYKGFVIAWCASRDEYLIYTKDEWELDPRCRYHDFEVGSVEEAIAWIDSY